MQRIQTQNSGEIHQGFPSRHCWCSGLDHSVGGHSVHCEVSCSIPGLDANSTYIQLKRQPKMTPVIVSCLCGVVGGSLQYRIPKLKEMEGPFYLEIP